ncbi:MAG: M20/M25/M40 family metallo-hydrolase [Planctomycetota bacterium]
MAYELLERLVNTAGVPGREHRVRDLILGELEGLVDSVRVDAMGSVIAVKGPTAGVFAGQSVDAGDAGGEPGKDRPTRVMLASHMDQIGFLVGHIDDKGFCYVNPVGGFDTRNLFSRMVTVCPDPDDPGKDLPAVMNPGGKPVHIASPEDRKKVPEVKEFVLDLGLAADEVKEKVNVGDMVVLRSDFDRLGPHLVGRAMDNRIACWLGVEALRGMKDKPHACTVCVVFTVQEEVGLRGALTSAFAVRPDIGIGVDTTLAVDTPGVSAQESVTKLGGGAGITIMDSSAIGDYGLIQQFTRLAEANKIPYQKSILSRGGTDTAMVQRAAAGCRAMTLSLPTRYIHTVTEMIHTGDLDACRDLLVAFLGDVDQATA